MPALMLDQAVRSATLGLPSQFASSSVSLFLARRRQNEGPRTPTNGPCESSDAAALPRARRGLRQERAFYRSPEHLSRWVLLRLFGSFADRNAHRSDSSNARGSDWKPFAGDALHLPGGACPQRALRGRPHRLWRGNREIPKRLRSRALDELKADARSWKIEVERDSVAASAYPAAGEKTATEESGFCSRHGEGGFRAAHILKVIIRAHRNRMFPRS